MKKEATLSFAIGYLFLFLMIIVVSIAAVPFMVQANEAFFSSGNQILAMGDGYAQQIQNESVKDTMTEIFDDTQTEFARGEPAVGAFVQFSWVFIIIVSTFIVLVLAKRSEMMTGGVI